MSEIDFFTLEVYFKGISAMERQSRRGGGGGIPADAAAILL